MEKEHADYRKYLAEKHPGEVFYTEDFADSRGHREKQFKQMSRFIAGLRKKSAAKRSSFFQVNETHPSAYSRSIVPLRRKFMKMLGWPLSPFPPVGGPVKVRRCLVHQDNQSRIERWTLRALEGMDCYGLLGIPANRARSHPLVILQHGGGGSPENIMGILPYWNYTNMGRRLMEAGFAVFCPQLYLWGDNLGPSIERQKVDSQLKQLGSSITALEIFKIQRTLDALTHDPRLDPARVGMMGLSYGGFYTLFTAAVDTRIKAAASSCFLNDRYVVDWPDWIWHDSGNTFLDSEVARLICPRPLYIEIGKRDELFNCRHAEKPARQIAQTYKRLKIPDRFHYKVFDGGHEFSRESSGINFLIKNLIK